MVVDTSAFVALILREPGYQKVELALQEADHLVLGTPSLVECGIVLATRLGRDPRSLIQRTIDQFGIEIVPFEREFAEVAIDAFLKFGKGRHAAGLNILDCMAYGMAKESGQPLLSVGEDFQKSDLEGFEEGATP